MNVLGFKDLGLNVKNHILNVLSNREQNIFILCVRQCLKIQFQASSSANCRKGRHVLPYSTDQELCLIDQKLQEKKFYGFLNQTQACKNVQGFILTCPHMKGKPQLCLGDFGDALMRSKRYHAFIYQSHCRKLFSYCQIQQI